VIAANGEEALFRKLPSDPLNRHTTTEPFTFLTTTIDSYAADVARASRRRQSP